ncbi:MAG TPA: hypothetical protein VLE99_03325 [Candidatus Saccharimonadales bacterium]|nr:hypothetical protein [Candidatus Saccharimonadales bacterium]
MTNLSLTDAKKKYPVALYSFLRVTNAAQAMARFLKDSSSNPTLAYPASLTVKRADRQLGLLEAELTHTDDAEVKKFLQHRLLETRLLQQFVRFKSSTVSAAQLKAYRADMLALYGPINKQYFNGVMTYLHASAQSQHETAALAALAEVRWQSAALPAPDQQTFLYYRRMLRHHLSEAFGPIPDGTDPADAIGAALRATGLAGVGWRVRRVPHATNIAVSRHGKTVNVGEHYRPESAFRLRQVIAHEVYGHARRFNASHRTASGWDEEGLAIVYEQLLARRFMYKRMLRYAALCLAWGADGVTRDFATTHRLMVPIVRLVSGRSSAAARRIAFKEVLRAFRGGNPNVPGMVLTKDKIYLESNLMVWQYLIDNKLDEPAFARLVDGQGSVPRKERME